MAIPAVVSKEEFDEKVSIEYQNLYTEKEGKMMLTEVTGIRTEADITRLQTALTKERNEHRATKTKAEEFLALGDIEDVRTKLDKYPELEAAAAGKGGNVDIEPIVESRLKAKLTPIQRELENTKKALTEKEGLIRQYETKETKSQIESALVQAAKGKVRDGVLDDILVYADIHFVKDEAGQIVTKEGIGVTAGVDPAMWLTEMLAKRQHWLDDSVGLGSNGSRGGPTGGANPWAADTWNMTQQAVIVKENPVRAEKLAKMAGTTVGGIRPVKK